MDLWETLMYGACGAEAASHSRAVSRAPRHWAEDPSLKP